MLSIARWAMASRTQATVAAGAALAIPLLFWLGAAIVALVTLRHGAAEGSRVFMWASLPGIAWLAAGDPTPLVSA